MKLTDVRAIITGGASGLGAAAARHFREEGAVVTLFDFDAARGQALAEEIGAHFAEVDVTDAGSVTTGLGTAVTAMGTPNVLVNCAGIATAERILGKKGVHRLESFQRTIDVNLVGTFNTLRILAEAMAANPPDGDGARGVVINTASVAAFDGQIGQAAYAASKAGIAGLTLPAARDLARAGIRVMAIAPGVFLTPMLEGLGDEIKEALAADVTFPNRLGDPAEFAALAGFIVECGYLNGETIRLDGALRMR